MTAHRAAQPPLDTTVDTEERVALCSVRGFGEGTVHWLGDGMSACGWVAYDRMRYFGYGSAAAVTCKRCVKAHSRAAALVRAVGDGEGADGG